MGMGWDRSTGAETTEVERRITETLDDELRFLRAWRERARESMRKLARVRPAERPRQAP
jgi:hypothetical protein